MTPAGLRRLDARVITKFTKAILPKYAANILFFDVNAYTLGKDQVSQ